MDKDRFQFIIITMIVTIILLVMFSACRTHRHYVTPGGVSVELPHTPQDSIAKGGGR